MEDIFKHSKVRDDKGNLLVCYHGTDIENIDEFKPMDSGLIWFTPDEWYASVHAEKRTGEGVIYPVYLNIEKLLYLDNIDSSLEGGKYNPRLRLLAGKLSLTTDSLLSKVDNPEFLYDVVNSKIFPELLKRAGYDGVYAEEGFSTSYGVLSDDQVYKIQDSAE